MIIEPLGITEFLVGILSLGGVIFTAWMGYRTKLETTLINRSVNHALPGEKRLYELVVSGNLKLNDLGDRLTTVESKLDAHIGSDLPCACKKIT